MAFQYWGEFACLRPMPGCSIEDLCEKIRAVIPRFPVTDNGAGHLPAYKFRVLDVLTEIHNNAEPSALQELVDHLTANNIQFVDGPMVKKNRARVLSYKKEHIPKCYVYMVKGK